MKWKKLTWWLWPHSPQVYWRLRIDNVTLPCYLTTNQSEERMQCMRWKITKTVSLLKWFSPEKLHGQFGAGVWIQISRLPQAANLPNKAIFLLQPTLAFRTRFWAVSSRTVTSLIYRYPQPLNLPKFPNFTCIQSDTLILTSCGTWANLTLHMNSVRPMTIKHLPCETL